MKKMAILVLLLFFLAGCSAVINNHSVAKNDHLDNNFLKINEISEIYSKVYIDDKPIIVFSSRDYTVFLLKSAKGKISELYWVIPEDEFKAEDIKTYTDYLNTQGIKNELKLSMEGVTGKIDDLTLYIVPKTNISTIVVENPIVIIDVDFFFRINRNKITQPKALDVLTFFRTLDAYNITPSEFVLLKSLDISLPFWTQEFAVLVEKIYPYWHKKEVPVKVLALDEADRLFNFAQYEDCFALLKEIEDEHKDNPFYFEKLFWTSMKLFRDDEVIASADKAYNLDGSMIELYIDGTDYLLSKDEIYPAYVLIKKGYEKEPWNKEIKSKFEEVVKHGYNYYNIHGEKELFLIFKEQYDKLKK